MPRLARAEVSRRDAVATVHVIARVVRQCFLLGADSVTRKNLRSPQSLDRRAIEPTGHPFWDRLVPSSPQASRSNENGIAEELPRGLRDRD